MVLLYTIGYEGKSIEEFKQILLDNSIDLLLDVRESGRSRKPYFSNGKLREQITSAGMEYAHMPVLGSPREIRNRLYETLDYETFFRAYKEYLKTLDGNLSEVIDVVYSKRVCLMCYEADASKCHRSVLAEEIREVDGNGLKISHL